MLHRARLSDHHSIIEHRYEKAAELARQGVPLFPNRYVPSHSCQQVLDAYESLDASRQSVRVAGRMMAIRRMGKAIFCHLLDASGRIQVYARRDNLPEADFERLKDLIDLGDFLGVEGTVFTTKTGERSIEATAVTLLSKSMRPLPEKYHGLKDTEIRYRQRYVDLFANPEVRDIFRRRAAIVASIRRQLDGLGYLEVETPMMQPIHGGASARPFVTHHNTLDMPLYLRIAPELYLKRLLVGGFERVYEINRNFRNEGISTRHNPEFTMLELYTAWWDYRDTMELTERLLRQAAQDAGVQGPVTFGEHTIDLLPEAPWRRISVLEGIREVTGLELDWSMSAAQVRQAAAGRVHVPGGPDAAAKESHEAGTGADHIMAIFEENVEKTLVQPTFVIEYPAVLSPLAKARPDNPAVAERFELYIGCIEVANAYSELNDPGLQFHHFENQLKRREAGDQEAQAMDEDYVRALEYGMPPASGLGIGIDRITMLCTGQTSIREVILFPLLRQEVATAPEAGAPSDAPAPTPEG